MAMARVTPLPRSAHRRVAFGLCAILWILASSNAFAQIGFTGGASTFSPPPTPPSNPVPPADVPLVTPPPGAATTVTPAPTIATPSAPLQITPPQPKQAAPASQSPGPRDPHAYMPTVPPGKIPLAVSARFSPDGPFIQRTVNWRVFSEKTEMGASPPMVAEAQDAFPVFALPAGNYIIHVSSGLASATKRIQLTTEPKKETLVLPVGGLRVQGRVGDQQIPPARLRFDVFEGSFLQRGAASRTRAKYTDRPPVLRNASGGDLVLLPVGTYYVQSTYGEGNAQIQADVRIEPGRLTDATVHHRAAQVTLRLVNVPGGEAIANTKWSVLTPGGDAIRESMIGAFPTVVLAEGEYVAIARSSDKTFQQNFKVQTGKDHEIEVLTR